MPARPPSADHSATRYVDIRHYEQMQAILLEIQAERSRQITVEGYDHAHDDTHTIGELATAAAAYAEWASERARTPELIGRRTYTFITRALWPFDWRFWKPKDPRADLVTAAALIVAEIERLDRAAGRAAA